MSRLDREFALLRERAMTVPLVRASRPVIPQVRLPGDILIGLSLNK